VATEHYASRDAIAGFMSTWHVTREMKIALAFAEIEVRRGCAAKRLSQKALAALAAQIEAPRLIGVALRQLAVCLELIEPLENLLNVFQVIAVVVDIPAGWGRCGVHFHSYHVARIVRRIELALAHVATVVNHLAIILSRFTVSKSNGVA
jgi:hypothetical protein